MPACLLPNWSSARQDSDPFCLVMCRQGSALPSGPIFHARLHTRGIALDRLVGPPTADEVVVVLEE